MHAALTPAYALLTGAATLAAHLPWPGDGKVARSLRARRDALPRLLAWAAAHRDLDRPLLWMHAASVGEGLMARPVLERLRTRHPEWQIVYSYFSPSAEHFAGALPVDVAGYLPFDAAGAAARLLDALRPTALVAAKLDLWPVLWETAARGGVRTGLISAALPARSGRTGVLARALSHDAYAALDAVGAVDTANGDRLAALGVRPDRLEVTGDTRYDQVMMRLEALDRTTGAIATLTDERPTLVAGSTWPADERILCRAWEQVVHQVPAARLIVAPHEPTPAHLEPLASWASLSGLDATTLPHATIDTDVVVVDRVGVLADLYALADVAYVGGGFHAAGLHSVVEPAALGVPVLIGPRHAGSRDAALLLAARAAVAAGDVDALTRAIVIALTEPETRARAGAAARAVVATELGAADRSTALVERLMA
ncbi:MAG: 3-deoxy-D-manno-octulosonic acid transferase [Gemmatimonadota bacterium]